MNKNLSWHVECLNNRLDTVKRLQVQNSELVNRIEKQLKDIEHYSAQISKAIEMKKPAFDRAKFMKRKTNA